jgi:hypothetical protein
MKSSFFDEAANVTPDQWARAARRRDEMVAEIQRRRDWGPWCPTDKSPPSSDVVMIAQTTMPRSIWDGYLPAGELIDLTERFAPRCEPEPPKLDREPESEFERQIAALLAEKPPEWLEYAFWFALLGLWAFVMLAICVLLAQ